MKVTFRKSGGFDAVIDSLKRISSVEIAVGFPKEGESTNKLHGKSHKRILDIAYWNHFGTPGAKHPIPPRPFLSNAESRLVDKVRMRLNKTGMSITNDDLLETIGIASEEAVRMQIHAWNPPNNADATIASKGFDHPLNDTGEMAEAVSYSIRKKTKK